MLYHLTLLHNFFIFVVNFDSTIKIKVFFFSCDVHTQLLVSYSTDLYQTNENNSFTKLLKKKKVLPN